MFRLATLLGFERASLQLDDLEKTRHDDVASFVVLEVERIGLFEEELGFELDGTVQMIGFEGELGHKVKQAIDVFESERGRCFAVDREGKTFEDLDGRGLQEGNRLEL